jgi:citrate lyase subunit beta/citryl-CoA lyase
MREPGDVAVGRTRSLLFVPADRPARIATALASNADAVIVDLEDAVRPEARAAARVGLAAALDGASKPVFVRVNPWGSDDFAADVEAALSAGVTGILLAKFVPGSPSSTLDEDLSAREEPHKRDLPLQVIGLIESASGVIGLTSAAALPHRITQLAWGAADLHLDVGLSPGSIGGIADFAMAALVLASRAAGLPAPLDSPCFLVEREAGDGNVEILAQEVARARNLGFGGKLCIHPRQLGAVNAGFAPTPTELAWARSVVAAWDDPTREARGAIAVVGELVDEAVIRRARQLLRD